MCVHQHQLVSLKLLLTSACMCLIPLLRAGTASSAEPPAVSRMVPDGFTQRYAGNDPLPPRSRRRRPAEEQGQCHNFNADAVLGRTSDVYDINGIVSVLCRCVVARHSARQESEQHGADGSEAKFLVCLLKSLWCYGSTVTGTPHCLASALVHAGVKYVWKGGRASVSASAVWTILQWVCALSFKLCDAVDAVIML